MKLFAVVLLLLAGCATTERPDYQLLMYLEDDGNVRMEVTSPTGEETSMTLKVYEYKPQ
jgi:hypothetical protein